ncbi:unnamed protein product [Boreogadus saida]
MEGTRVKPSVGTGVPKLHYSPLFSQSEEGGNHSFCIAARSQYRLSLSEATEQHQTDISLSSSEAEAESVYLGNRLAWQLDSSGKMPCSIKVCAGDIVPANQPLVIQSLIETLRRQAVLGLGNGAF